MVATGLRSSWEASATNWRWDRAEASSRSSIWLRVDARWATSSSPGGSGSRVPEPVCVISDAVRRSRSTGANARPASVQLSRPTSRTTAGTPIASNRVVDPVASSTVSRLRAATT